jgi:hypothetical protein
MASKPVTGAWAPALAGHPKGHLHPCMQTHPSHTQVTLVTGPPQHTQQLLLLEVCGHWC